MHPTWFYGWIVLQKENANECVFPLTMVCGDADIAPRTQQVNIIKRVPYLFFSRLIRHLCYFNGGICSLCLSAWKLKTTNNCCTEREVYLFVSACAHGYIFYACRIIIYHHIKLPHPSVECDLKIVTFYCFHSAGERMRQRPGVATRLHT